MAIPVLVVDASEEFGTLIRSTLEDTRLYRVSLATSGAEAIEVARSSNPQLAIIDFDLPDIKGPEVIRQLRATLPDLSVIAIPYTNDPEDPTIKELAVDGLLTKPFYLPDLPLIVADALGLSPELSAPQAKPSVETPAWQEEDLPHWLANADQAAQYLNRLASESSAIALMLTRGQHIWAYAGQLTQDQVQELERLIADLWTKEGARGSIVKFIRLPDQMDDFLLHATTVVADIVLSIVFQADTPFSVTRRQAQHLAKALSQVEPLEYDTSAAPSGSTDAATQPVQNEDSDQPPVETSEPLSVAPDIPFPSDLNPPPPDPVPGREVLIEPFPEASIESLPIPGDWVPEVPRPASHLPYLDEPKPPPLASEPDTPTESEIPLPEAEYHLPITAVLIPRFPEHQLTGPLALSLQDWVERMCLAWDWRADQITIEPSHLSLTISLSPEIAPAYAVNQLQHDLSERVLEAFPELAEDLPSRRFWARSYLMLTGAPPTPQRVLSFIQTTRHAQGFTS
jgi:CheY-like chemotaxis protein